MKADNLKALIDKSNKFDLIVSEQIEIATEATKMWKKTEKAFKNFKVETETMKKNFFKEL